MSSLSPPFAALHVLLARTTHPCAATAVLLAALLAASASRAAGSESDAARPRPGVAITLRHGIAFDRRIFESERANPTAVFRPYDIVNCRQMGFDHVKLLFTPDRMITEDGHLAADKVEPLKADVNTVLRAGLRCIVCIHPGDAFKRRYLGNPREFDKLLTWYADLGEVVASAGAPEQVALQLMTEPFGRPADVSWDSLSNRMIAAARSRMPRHTILTSAEYGSIDKLTQMKPGPDANVIYTFTDYEPHLIGINSMPGSTGFMPFLRRLQYPGDPSHVTPEAIEDCIAAVPEALKPAARDALQAFAAGAYDMYPSRPNRLGGRYDGAWQLARARAVRDWSDRNGGVPVMCVEFGCYDARHRRPGGAAGLGPSVAREARLAFLRDKRAAFDQCGIAWTYWSYNEDFSVYDLARRIPLYSPDAKRLGPSWYDRELLVRGLGLRPATPEPSPTGRSGRRSAPPARRRGRPSQNSAASGAPRVQPSTESR